MTKAATPYFFIRNENSSFLNLCTEAGPVARFLNEVEVTKAARALNAHDKLVSDNDKLRATAASDFKKMLNMGSDIRDLRAVNDALVKALERAEAAMQMAVIGKIEHAREDLPEIRAALRLANPPEPNRVVNTGHGISMPEGES